MSKNRRHAAIMFTDIVGYTALMGSDEDRAFEVLAKNREIHNQLIGKYNGTLIKEMGDGMLVSFNLASDAVRCAIEIQKASKGQDILLKIGIHEGEMVFEGTDVLGDGMNIASRLQEDPPDGCISISGSVYRDVKNKPEIKSEFIEEKSFKNVDEPIKVYRACNREGQEEHKKYKLAGDRRKSIAVLPFLNMSADPEQDYFCDGMTEEIINALSHVESIKVISRTSTFMFKGKLEDIRKIGKKLNVDSLLEGSVRKSGDRIKITAQLINVTDGLLIWSEAYNRNIEDVFAIQEEISLAIVGHLKVKLLRNEKARIKEIHTKDLEAYHLYLKGYYYMQMLTNEGYQKAMKYFEQSIEKDPNYALGYAGIAKILILESEWGNMTPNQNLPKAKKYLLKALSICDTLSEAYASLGVISIFYDWDFESAEKQIKEAIYYNPSSGEARLCYSWYLSLIENHEKAIEESKHASELDPLASLTNTWAAYSYWWAGRFREAEKELMKVISLFPNYHFGHHCLGDTYAALFEKSKAKRSFQKAINLSGGDGDPISIANLACLCYETGSRQKAEKLISELKERSQHEYIPDICFLVYAITQGDLDQALIWLESVVEKRDMRLLWNLIQPIERYRIPEDPRLNQVLSKTGLLKSR